MRSARLVAAVVAAGVLLTGCSGKKEPAHSSATSTETAPTATVTTSAPTSTPLGAGQRAWAAWSDRTRSYDDWWAALKPLLSEAARATYQYDDPRNIPAMKVTGPIRLAKKAPAAPKYTASVVVPTDKGTFRLDLERHRLHGPWLLYGIAFPKGIQ